MSRLEILIAVVTAIAFVALLWDTHKRRLMAAWDKGYRRGYAHGTKRPDCEIEFIAGEIEGPMRRWPPATHMSIPYVDGKVEVKYVGPDGHVEERPDAFGLKEYDLERILVTYEPTS